MKLTKDDIIEIAIMNGIKLPSYKVKLAMIATEVLLKILNEIGRAVCPKLTSKWQNWLSTLNVEDIEGIIEVAKEYESDIDDEKKYNSVKDFQVVTNESTYEPIEDEKESLGGVEDISLVANEDDFTTNEIEILRNSDRKHFNATSDRHRWFTFGNILDFFEQNNADMTIPLDANPADFQFKCKPVWLKGRETFVPCAIYKDNSFDRGSLSSHLRCVSFQKEADLGLTQVPEMIEYFFVLRFDKNMKIIGRSNIVKCN